MDGKTDLFSKMKTSHPKFHKSPWLFVINHILGYSVKAIVMGNRRQFLSIRHPRAKMTQQLHSQKDIYYLIYWQCLRFFSKQLQNKTVDG